MPAWNLYDIYRRKQVNGSGSINWSTPGGNGLKIALVSAGYTLDQNVHDFFDNASSEVVGTGYTTGGNAIASPTVTMDGSGVVTVDANDPATWTENGAGFTDARRAVLYRDTGTAATSELVCVSDDFGADKGNAGGDLTVQLDAAGVFTSSR